MFMFLERSELVSYLYRRPRNVNNLQPQKLQKKKKKLVLNHAPPCNIVPRFVNNSIAKLPNPVVEIGSIADFQAFVRRVFMQLKTFW